MRVCTQKAQQDLRYEENIDAFSMNGQQGRASPTLRMDSKDEGRITPNIPYDRMIIHFAHFRQSELVLGVL